MVAIESDVEANKNKAYQHRATLNEIIRLLDSLDKEAASTLSAQEGVRTRTGIVRDRARCLLKRLGDDPGSARVGRAADPRLVHMAKPMAATRRMAVSLARA